MDFKTQDTDSMDNLYPALIQCFAVIICGYLAGRFNLVTDTESKTLNLFIGTFSLPALIFLSLAELDLSSVNWLFLISILIAKTIVFSTVIIVTLLVVKPFNLTKAGLFAIFCTQSNDFAIGYPLVMALYRSTHPEYASYIYLMAPISLAMLNPIAFILMEIQKMRANANNSLVQITDIKSQIKMVYFVIKSVIFNPIVAMTLLGIFGNIVFKHKVPVILADVLKVLGDAFTATALFSLGLRMVNKVHKLKGVALIVPGILIIVKLIVLPLVTRETVNLMLSKDNSNDTLDLSTYGFLYGTFPSAPGVFVFATQYDVEIDLIASAMVACTFLSAPLMFISAKMISITNLNPADYLIALDSYTLDIGIAGIVTCVWLILVILITKRFKEILYKVTICLIISQLLMCIGVIVWYSTIEQNNINLSTFEFMLFSTGTYSSRLWTTILAISLLFLQCRSICFVTKLLPYFMAVGWGIPLIISLILVLIGQGRVAENKRNINFQNNSVQAAITVFLLSLCFTITIGCIVLQQRYRKKYEQYLSLVQDIMTPDNRCSIQSDTAERQDHRRLSPINESTSQSFESPVVDIEEIFGVVSSSNNSFLNRITPQPDDVFNPRSNLCPSRFGCRQGNCHAAEQSPRTETDSYNDSEEADTNNETQTLRHVVLLIFLLVSMFIGLAVSTWTLIMEEISGIYIELAFLDVTLNIGQSMIVFAIFGINIKEIQQPLLRVWRKLYYGADILILPTHEELSFETRFICEQFKIQNAQKCEDAIGRERRYRLKVYRKSFTGCELINWLMDAELVQDRVEGVQYGSHLLLGRVIRHVERIHHFHDKKTLYTFEP